jgi:hypothetical protein
LRKNITGQEAERVNHNQTITTPKLLPPFLHAFSDYCCHFWENSNTFVAGEHQITEFYIELFLAAFCLLAKRSKLWLHMQKVFIYLIAIKFLVGKLKLLF